MGIPSYELYACDISKFCEAHPYTILRILELSEGRRILYHGVKKKDALAKIFTKGREPKTPEGGYVSWWSTGLCLFTTQRELPLKESSTFDTSFFNYAHNEDGMSLLVTDYQTLKDHGINIEWRNDDQITISRTVPPDALSILNVTVEHDDISGLDESIKYTAVTKGMLEAILEHLEGYSVGKRVQKKITI